jgi:hypothetical protein
MKYLFRSIVSVALLCLTAAAQSNSQTSSTTNNANNPTWWAKYQYLLKNGADKNAGATSSLLVGPNVDVSNECGPQSETYININTRNPKNVAGGSNEIFRLPMRGYASSDSGSTWSGVDLPLPAPRGGNNDTDFGSDPSVAFDTRGNLYYGYIVVFFGNGNGVNGTEMAVAKSTDGGFSYPSVNFFDFQTGSNHFNDKPMITADTNLKSPFRDRVYIAWDAASGGTTTGGGIQVAASADGGATFTITRADDPSGPGKSIGAVPFIGPNGELYVAWNDYKANAIVFNRSFDGGATWGNPTVVSYKTLPFDIGIPAEQYRGALVYPACDADRSTGANRGKLYCSWMDLKADGTTDIFVSSSSDKGSTWTLPQTVGDQLGIKVDRFNHWLAVDAVTGQVNTSFYDTRNDTTGSRYMTDIYFTQSNDGGATWRGPNTRVTDVSSNEHDCNGTFPCLGINYGDQQGDYAGIASYGGVSRPLWVDSRKQLSPSSGCRTNLAMEEVFTAAVK